MPSCSACVWRHDFSAFACAVQSVVGTLYWLDGNGRQTLCKRHTLCKQHTLRRQGGDTLCGRREGGPTRCKQSVAPHSPLLSSNRVEVIAS